MFRNQAAAGADQRVVAPSVAGAPSTRVAAIAPTPPSLQSPASDQAAAPTPAPAPAPAPASCSDPDSDPAQAPDSDPAVEGHLDAIKRKPVETKAGQS